MPTTAFTLDFTGERAIKKGISFGPIVFNFKQENGDPFDLSDGGPWKVFSHARRHKGDKLKIDLMPVVTDASNGEVQMSFTDEQTLALMGGDYLWDLVLEMPDGTRLGPYFEGKLRVDDIVTHG